MVVYHHIGILTPPRLHCEIITRSWEVQCHQSGLIHRDNMTSLIRENSLRFIVEPESIPNIPNEVDAEHLVVGENASIALEVLGAQGRDVWIFGITCIHGNGSEHPAFRVIKVNKNLKD